MDLLQSIIIIIIIIIKFCLWGRQEEALGKKNERAICPKDKQVFFSPRICKLAICPLSVLLM